MLVSSDPKLNHKRTLAVLRARFPLLLPTLSLLLGQLTFCASVLPIWTKLLIALSASLLYLRYASGARYLLCCALFVLIGILQQKMVLHLSRSNATFEESGVLLAIDGPIRQRRTDELQLSVKILGKLDLSHGLLQDIALSPLQSGERALCKALNLPWRNASGLQQGDRFLVRALFQPLQQEGLYDFSSTLLRQGYTYRCKVLHSTKPLAFKRAWNVRARIALIELFSHLLGDSERSGLLLSLFLGVRDLLHASTEEAFKRTGLAHLLVFSGYQVVLFFHFIEFLCGIGLALLTRVARVWCLGLSAFISLRKLGLVVAFILTVLFEVVVGAEQSTIRASLALLFFVVAKLVERQSGFFNAIIFALFVMHLITPGCLLEPGVQLTFAALCGIGLAQGLEQKISLKAYLRTQGYIWLLTTPLSLLWFGRGSLVALPLNLVLAPLVSFLACNLGAAFLALNLSALDAQGVLLGCLADLLMLIRDVVIEVSHWPGIWFELDAQSAITISLVSAVLIGLIYRGKLRQFLNQEPGIWRRGQSSGP